MSHDRFFMDKLYNKLLVFEGEGKVKEWVGSYRTAREAEIRGHASEQRPAPAPPRPQHRRQESAREEDDLRRTLGTAEDRQGDAKLEAKKAELLTSLSKSGTDHHKMMDLSLGSKDHGPTGWDDGSGWLVLSEKIGFRGGRRCIRVVEWYPQITQKVPPNGSRGTWLGW
ncbi:MAG: hypothetical protein R2818_11640 [Flavobacteriales bacterium]